MMQICDQKGWTYHQYKSNPNWFLELLKTKLLVEAEVAKAKARQQSQVAAKEKQAHGR